ncbi:myophilin-like [Clytia hemisphaerica]|uniref:Calponin n=1 Tax=Clytia hemisphaerica TaxID=252671 RepID=A0A7M5WRM7_9CNID
MANRPKGFGMTAELNRKKEAKFDPDLATDCFQWLKEVLNDGGKADLAASLPSVIGKSADVISPLKNGKILCEVINVIKPGSVKKINENKMTFKEMENIGNFLAACEKIGCVKNDLFQTVDLYEGQNINQVINGIVSLGRKAQTIGYNGPCLGPTESTENKREFTDEQLKAGEGIIGLQMGSNKGASQAGQNFGKTRAIID